MQFLLEKQRNYEKFKFVTKYYNNEIWVHLICALWMPEIDLTDSLKENPVLKCLPGRLD